jgi:hypothetical protein
MAKISPELREIIDKYHTAQKLYDQQLTGLRLIAAKIQAFLNGRLNQAGFLEAAKLVSSHEQAIEIVEDSIFAVYFNKSRYGDRREQVLRFDITGIVTDKDIDQFVEKYVHEQQVIEQSKQKDKLAAEMVQATIMSELLEQHSKLLEHRVKIAEGKDDFELRRDVYNRAKQMISVAMHNEKAEAPSYYPKQWDATAAVFVAYDLIRGKNPINRSFKRNDASRMMGQSPWHALLNALRHVHIALDVVLPTTAMDRVHYKGYFTKSTLWAFLLGSGAYAMRDELFARIKAVEQELAQLH